VPPEILLEQIEIEGFELLPASSNLACAELSLPDSVGVKPARLLTQAPWVRSFGKCELTVSTEGWVFPSPPPELDRPPVLNDQKPPAKTEAAPTSEVVPVEQLPDAVEARKKRVRAMPSNDTVLVKDRLLYLLQPPLEGLFDRGQLGVPFEPFPYQLEGIAFLMPRDAALLADEMGLGKTMQTILALRLLFHQGLLKSVLLITPKPLIHNWCRELKQWGPDIPFEVFPADPEQRRVGWFVSNCPVKLINYESLTRDVDLINDPRVKFDLVILDEAQRIKNRDSKTAQIVRSVRRNRSWALTGTPIENHPDDLVNLFAFIDPERVPADTPFKKLTTLTSNSILRRTKEDVQSDMPPKIIRDLEVDLSPAQQSAYDLAEKEGVVHLNELGETITVQHVFQLVMRLKQICNFDPLTGESAKLEQLLHDMEEVFASGRKAIIFSQWVEPLNVLAKALEPFGPLLYHGGIKQELRTPILDQFKHDPSKHIILMTYGSGSVGLNLQFANYVFLFDRWWNPAVEDQAINRAHRIGQRHPVTVTRFLSQNTIESRIATILDAKRKILNDFLAQSDKPNAIGLTEDEIFGLFNIQSRPKREK
jgi:SNF2 family DNA or RNA helicase